MQYRLLRNNKESGPYTKAQLEAMGLKPYDLLWIEGRGGAWQYASEIPDLKSIAPIVEEQPYDRFYKGKENQTASGSKQSNNTYTSDTATATGKTATKSPKPRIRITGDKVVMIDNTALQQPQPIDNIISAIPKEQPAAKAIQPPVKQEPTKQVQTAGPDWEEVYTDWKADDIKQEEFAAAPAVAKTQNFEEIKQRYEESKLKQLDEKQHKTSNAVKQNIMAAIAVLVLAIGGYAGYKLNNSTAGNRATQNAPVEKAEVIQDENSQPQNGTGNAAGTAATPSQQTNLTNANEAKQNEIKNSLSQGDNTNNPGKQLPQVDNTKSSTATLPPTSTSNKTTLPVLKKETTPVNNKPANTVAKTDNQPTTKSPVVANSKAVNSSLNNKTSGNKKETDLFTDVQKAITTAAVQTQPVTAPPIVKKEAPKKRISDYVTVNKLGSTSNTGSVQNVLLSVKNVTDFPIDLAVIDIQYYGSNGRYQKGETMYVRNIGVGDNVNVRIPDSRTSNSISYKVSLVSSEQKTLYLVGD